jgi:hypothetical protein
MAHQTHEQIVLRLNTYWPGTQWVLRGSRYSDLEWLDQVVAKPSKEELFLEE